MKEITANTESRSPCIFGIDDKRIFLKVNNEEIHFDNGEVCNLLQTLTRYFIKKYEDDINAYNL